MRANFNSASTSLAMPTSGRRISPSTRRPSGFSSRRMTAKRRIQFVRRHVLRDRIHDDEIDRLFVHLREIIERADADLGVRRKARDQPAADAGGGLGQIELGAGVGYLGRRQRLAAGIVQHDRVGRGDVADDVARDDLEMQVAMQLARINRMRGIVIVDPFVHARGVRQNGGSGAGTA